jgi:rhodanese-related sulfurtransferase
MAKQVSVLAAADLMRQGWRYLDVRSVPEFEAGHPEGATNVPLAHLQGGRMVPNPDFQAVIAANFPADAKLLIGCKMGGRSAQAAALLEAAGFAEIIQVRGGYVGERDPFGRLEAQGWVDAGLPIAKLAAPADSYAELLRKRPAG